MTTKAPFRIVAALLLCAALSAAEATYVPSASPFPGFITFAAGGDARDATNVSVATIVEIRADGRGCVVICDISGQRREFPTRMLAQQFAALLAAAKR